MDAHNSARRTEAQNIAVRVLSTWQAGEDVDEAALIASRPDLAPELAEELAGARMIRATFLAATRAMSVSDGESDYPRVPGYCMSGDPKAGGQAIVYKARQETTDRWVAVKILHSKSSITQHRFRFEREATTLSALNHPNLVTILDRGRLADGSFFLVMNWVDGVDLKQYWSTLSDSAEDTRKLLTVFRKLADAIAAAHAAGILHRDLKPSNIQINSREEPMILDFGLSRLIERRLDERSVTGSGEIVGSIPWASPEQASSQELTPSSDLYALGVMLYEAVARQRPYPADGMLIDALDCILHHEPVSPSKAQAARAFPDRRALDAVILKLLAKLPKDRYQSGTELAADLDALLDGRRPKAMAPTSHATTRRQWLVGASAALVLASLAGGYMSIYRKRAEDDFAVYSLPSITNSLGIRFVKIPAVLYQSSTSQIPNVWVDSFYLATTETTQKQYFSVMHANPTLPGSRGDDLPVTSVSAIEANLFCQRLSASDAQYSYRLPTTPEWDSVCRRARLAHSTDEAWRSDASHSKLQPVGTKRANHWGIYDMLGNAAEMVIDKTDVGARGGSYLDKPEAYSPASVEQLFSGTKSPHVGFRLVLLVKKK